MHSSFSKSKKIKSIKSRIVVISAGGDEKFLTETKCMGRENF